MLFTGPVGPYWEKLCPRSEYSRPWAQFLPIRTSQLVNNIYLLTFKYLDLLKRPDLGYWYKYDNSFLACHIYLLKYNGVQTT